MHFILRVARCTRTDKRSQQTERDGRTHITTTQNTMFLSIFFPFPSRSRRRLLWADINRKNNIKDED